MWLLNPLPVNLGCGNTRQGSGGKALQGCVAATLVCPRGGVSVKGPGGRVKRSGLTLDSLRDSLATPASSSGIILFQGKSPLTISYLLFIPTRLGVSSL